MQKRELRRRRQEPPLLQKHQLQEAGVEEKPLRKPPLRQGALRARCWFLVF